MTQYKGKILVVGSSNTDMTVLTDELPRPGETVLGGDFKMGPGGKGANQAVIAKRLGGDVRFVCKVGKDLFGDKSIERYKKEGLKAEDILRSDKPSGVALIPVDKMGENSIIVASGANGDFSPADIEGIRPLIEECDILLLQLEIPIPSVLKAAEIGSKAGARVILNPAPATSLPEEIFRHISIFIPNETELSSFSGVQVNDGESAKKAAAAMRCKGVKDIIVTMGSNGSLICSDNESTIIPARKVKALDTTGAGDTFCAGLCVGLSEGMTLGQAAAFATAAASIAVQRLGAQEAAPYRNEVDELLK